MKRTHLHFFDSFDIVLSVAFPVHVELIDQMLGRGVDVVAQSGIQVLDQSSLASNRCKKKTRTNDHHEFIYNE